MKVCTRKSMLAMAAGILLFGAGATAASADTLSVDDDRRQRRDAEFTSINAAVAAADPGDTIEVYPGTYHESVTVEEPLRLRGFHANGNVRDHCSRPSDPNRDAIVVPPGDGRPGFLVLADNVLIEGFFIEGLPANNSPGIFLSPDHSGYRIENNVFRSNHYGLDLNSSGARTTLVSRNCFMFNNANTTPVAPGGDGIYSDPDSEFAAADRLRNAVIEKNLFVGNQDNGIILIGNDAPGDQNTISNVLIEKNDFFDNDDGIVLEALNRVAVEKNNLVRNEDGVVLFGAENITVSKNDVSRSVTGDGIALFSSRNNFLEKNRSFNNDLSGIFVDMDSRNNRIEKNQMRGNARSVPPDRTAFDAHDESVGTRTAGTANFWIKNECQTANRPGLCDHPQIGRAHV